MFLEVRGTVQDTQNLSGDEFQQIQNVGKESGVDQPLIILDLNQYNTMLDMMHVRY